MKLLLTTIQEDTFAVTRGGETVGEMINNMIVANMINNVRVTHIAVEITPEDETALRLLRSPAFESGDKVQSETRPFYKSASGKVRSRTEETPTVKTDY